MYILKIMQLTLKTLGLSEQNKDLINLPFVKQTILKIIDYNKYKNFIKDEIQNLIFCCVKLGINILKSSYRIQGS